MRKHRLTVLCVSALGALGVISSGFAGWVITMGPKDASGTGSITADGVVTRQGVESCELEGGNTAKTIRFAATKTPAPGGHGWLTASGNEAVMSAAFTFTITTTEANMTVNFTELKFEEKDADNKYGKAKDKGLVGSLPAFGAATGNGVGTIALEGATLGSDSKNATATATSTTLNVTFTVTFAWGKTFGYENPLDYYNKSSYTSDLDLAANTNIGALKDLDGATFALSFKVSATPNA